jgi:hypothetical protein
MFVDMLWVATSALIIKPEDDRREVLISLTKPSHIFPTRNCP